MIKKTFFLSLLAFTGFLLFTQTPQAEARSHSRSTNVQLNVNAGYRNDAYVTRRYARPVIIAPAAPVYMAPAFHGPCYTPVYAYPAPTIVEEVYVAPAPRSFFGLGLGGLSFSWNFFK
jgi:hypothetical protein